MGITWTKEQEQVIRLRERNLLVSAAAGSGKTAVLVARILSMITDPKNPIDIDRLLIVTFTRAAAAEMRARLAAALDEQCALAPNDRHLQKQTTLLHTAQITTIDGFCAYVVRSYFHVIGLDPSFKVAEEGEVTLLKTDVLEELLDEAYASQNPAFEKFVESFSAGKNDNDIEQHILDLARFSESYPWPDEWLQQCAAASGINENGSLSDLPWMPQIWKMSHHMLAEAQSLLQEALHIAHKPQGPFPYEEAIQSDLEFMAEALQVQDYTQMFQMLQGYKFPALSRKKSEALEVYKTTAKDLRDQAKKIVKQLTESFFTAPEAEVCSVLANAQDSVEMLVALTRDFRKRLAEKKQAKGIADFSDVAHYALDILIHKEADSYAPSQVAIDLSRQFTEIMIDEYQDSNHVQEMILTSVSRYHLGERNIFMVGDVKQSIYRFRLARPELFMEKFHTYALTEAKEQRIDLHKNFRSRNEVLTSINYLFAQLMQDDMGDITYSQEVALYPGADYPEPKAQFCIPEVRLIDTSEEDEPVQPEPYLDEFQIEAMDVAGRIREIVELEEVYDAKAGSYRSARFSDIVILLRSVSAAADAFAKTLLEQGIPAHAVSKTGYFSAQEVQTVLNYLRICDNPRQEIPLTAVLHSLLVGLTPTQLTQIKTAQEGLPMYEAVCAYSVTGEDVQLREKLQAFLRQLNEIRDCVSYTTTHDLVLRILEDTNYGNQAAAMPGGAQRKANLEFLVEKARSFERSSYKGLFQFIRYIDKLNKYEVDFGEVNIVGERENTVRIMSIHKSKGLEFSIVFVSCMGRQINLMSSRAKVQIHPTLGIGLDSIYPQERMRIPTLQKALISRQSKIDDLGEELRILYVAMTRAKEKLILTGITDKLNKQLEKAPAILSSTAPMLSYQIRENPSTYWGWILPALARHSAIRPLYDAYGIPYEAEDFKDAGAQFVIHTIPVQQVRMQAVHHEFTQLLQEDELRHWDTKLVYDAALQQTLEERFGFIYPHEVYAGTPVKLSVSELKKLSTQEDSTFLYEAQQTDHRVPAFIEVPPEAAGARRGTAYHRVMELLDYAYCKNLTEVEEQLRRLFTEQRISREVYEAVEAQDVLGFTQSAIGQRMQQAAQAGRLVREQPFVLSEPGNRLHPDWSHEKILIQGVIDAYFYEGDTVVIVDYKTDRVPEGDIELLGKRYRVQLDYYAKALERATHREVAEKIIYSFTLQQELSL
ncbi:MAG: helicase-exonuclease AddAB subunit AddA [Lachnospiraceae bacterium]